MRTNRGKPSGTFQAQLGNWNLYQTADGRFKVSAIDPVNGKANYSFAVKDGKLDAHASPDASKLRTERPELCKSVEEFFRTAEVIPSAEPTGQPVDEGDPYGDLALSRRRKLSPEQNWKRELLQMRRLDLKHRAAKKTSLWDSAVRMLWAALFGTKIDDDTAAKAVAWIEQHQGDVSLSTVLQIETEYFSGKYAPNSCATMESQLDMLAGNIEFTTEANNESGTDEGRAVRSSSAGESTDRISGTDPLSDFL